MPFERGIIQFSNRYMNQNSLNVESSEKEFDFCDCDKMKKKFTWIIILHDYFVFIVEQSSIRCRE